MLNFLAFAYTSFKIKYSNNFATSGNKINLTLNACFEQDVWSYLNNWGNIVY